MRNSEVGTLWPRLPEKVTYTLLSSSTAGFATGWRFSESRVASVKLAFAVPSCVLTLTDLPAAASGTTTVGWVEEPKITVATASPKQTCAGRESPFMKPRPGRRISAPGSAQEGSMERMTGASDDGLIGLLFYDAEAQQELQNKKGVNSRAKIVNYNADPLRAQELQPAN